MNRPSNTLLPRRGVLSGLAVTGAAVTGAAVAGAAVATGLAASAYPGQTAVRQDAVRQDAVRQDAVRQDAARLPASRVALLEQTIAEMQRRSKRDPTDPKGWRINALAHTDVCSTVSNGDPRQVHGCWWFLPWHRAFLAVTEWKLRALSGDPTLSLPYWNWSVDRRIPPAFAQAGSALAQAVRYTPNRDLRAVEIDRLMFDPGRARLGVAALDARSFVARTPSEIPTTFGGIARPNAGGWHGRSRMETIPHNAVHNYVGGEATNGDVGDMTDLATAAFDPVFYAHHGNLDRLWEVWRQDPARKATEPDDSAFTQKQFLFPWIDGTIISVPMRDVLDTRRLGYVYDSLAVLRDDAAPADDAAPSNVSGPQLANARVRVPSGSARCILTISGVEPGDRPLSAEVCVGRPGDPASWISVGALAMGSAHGPAVFPDTVPRFDVTAAVRTLGTPTIAVAVLPLALAVGQRNWPLFQYAGMEIVAAG